jgi:hypothetical protein
VKKILLTALTLALAIGGATAVFAAVGDDPAPSHTSRTTRTAQDVPGPCDEAEHADEAGHADDPRCAGGDGRHDEAAGDQHQRGRGADEAPEDEIGEDVPGNADEARDEIGEDVPGPCDEAEHASDPRCAPGVPAEDPAGEVDNSGPGSVNSGPSGEADDHGGESGHSGPGDGGEGNDD